MLERLPEPVGAKPGRQLYGPILCYGWKGNNIQPMNKDVQTEMLDRLKDIDAKLDKLSDRLGSLPGGA